MLKVQYFVNLCKELTHWKRTWCRKRVRASRGGGNRGWNFECIIDSVDLNLSKLRERVKNMWKPGVLQVLGLPNVGHSVWLNKNMSDLSSLARDWTYTTCIKKQNLNHWTTREIPILSYFLWILLALFLNSLLFMGISSCSILKKLSLLHVITFEVKVKLLVTQPCLNLCNTMDCIPAGFSVCGRNSLGKNTGMGNHSLLQRIFLTQGWNLGLPHYRQILYHLRH